MRKTENEKAEGERTRPGALVISLDFELHWGVRPNVRPGDPYIANLLGARAAVPRLLQLFERRKLHATWATVGMLFAGERGDRIRWDPAERPKYEDSALDSYAEAVGENEASDPLHYGRSLVSDIRRTGGQEIGSHTYAHTFCKAPGITEQAIRADLAAARAAAASLDLQLTSIVFPRNRWNRSFDHVLSEAGIQAYRGNPTHWSYRHGTGGPPLARTVKYLDSYTGGVAAPQLWSTVLQPHGLADVRGTLFLRPWSKLGHSLSMRAIKKVIRTAARTNRIAHIWWHPHNHGLNLAENLSRVEQIADEFDMCRERYGMRSLNMREASDLARIALD